MIIITKTVIGTEQYWNTENLTREPENIVYSYGFLTPDGKLFQCVKRTLEACRKARDAWLGEM